MDKEHLKLEDWLSSDKVLTKEAFFVYTQQTRRLQPNDQILFLKKVISQIAKGYISLKIEDLCKINTFSLEAYQEFGEPVNIDYTLDLIIHILEFVAFKGKFPRETKEIFDLVKSIADFICNYLQDNVDYLSKIDLLFDDCPGRTAIVRKSTNDFYIHLRGNDYKVYDIYQGYSIKNQDKDGNGTLVLHFQKGIYAKGNICLLEVLERRINTYTDDTIKYGNNIEYQGRKFPFSWRRNESNFLIVPEKAPVTSCEGRKSDKSCELSSKEFWWCYGRKCFKANQVDHEVNDWNNYTLRDFLKILSLSYNDSGYYIFISEINRLNRLLERIRCTDCSKVLRPAKLSNFGFYRVSYFYCLNNDCSSKGKEVYLTHCLNSKCTNVIDNRVAKRCLNGFIICDKCGSCCSNDQFLKRSESLKILGRPLPQKLSTMLTEQKGHWEKAECYCYKCQKEMIEKNGSYNCKECSVTYDRTTVYVKFYRDYKKVFGQKFKKYEQKGAQ
ncbi:hypothetical protein GCM10028803_31400 [Larkinella knui]|uniref:Uncharacterized protein n=1 Tax=Larkinella knui TaxID=2025310 RepID=A0A3P1CXW8_9BACT|nr:hypothetical protein [Larkinella knui]RRB18165.1 hypothetical protein EHT87_07780 [Larkinella knui]